MDKKAEVRKEKIFIGHWRTKLTITDSNFYAGCFIKMNKEDFFTDRQIKKIINILTEITTERSFK